MRKVPALLSVLAVAAPLGLAACGSSSSGSGTTTTSANQRTQIADCLRKQGITPPPGGFRAGGGRPPGGGGGGGGLFGGGSGGGPPGGANATKFRDALRKCGVNGTASRRGSNFTTAAGKQALNKFVACVRSNGYNLPAPNTSGNGPVFDPSKVNRSDPKLQSAARKCQSLLPRPTPQPPAG